jgi:fermentation-respiration switch protein FrsA (DUF1100 family)
MRLTLAIVVTAAVLLAIIWTLQRRMIYFPLQEVPSPADLAFDAVEEVTFDTADGLRLHGWFFGVPFAGGSRLPITVLVFQGNAGNRAYRAAFAQRLRGHGLQVMLFDYRGYGGNPGSPSERGLASDSRAARAWLVARSGVDPSRVVYFGESLGTGVATELAAAHPPAALVLRSPFASLADVARYHYPLLPAGLLLRDRFDSISRIARVGAPILIIAGSRDGIVPLDSSRRLYEAAPDPKRLLVISGADHNDEVLFTGDEMIAAIVRFLEPLR